MSDTQQQAYRDDFEKFLSHTNEKEILFGEIIKEAEKRNAQSLLDIGAGNGLLSIPLATHMARYLAVEQKDSFVDKLRAAGLDTLHDSFPTHIEERFDIVLFSHSLSYGRKTRMDFEPFIRAAWDLVAPSGELLIVTYKGQEDDWTHLMERVGENPIDSNRVGYNTLIMLLNTLGEVKVHKVKSIVKTGTLEEMLYALSFVASDGEPVKKEKFLEKRVRVEKILNSEYQVAGGIEFPFWHYLISTYK